MDAAREEDRPRRWRLAAPHPGAEGWQPSPDPARPHAPTRWTLVLAAALAGMALAACSSGTETVPPQCIDSPAAIERALASAPAPVRLQGAPISRCFARRADQGSLEGLGQILIPAAENLGAQARAAPSSHAAVEFGYLIGAARRGAGRGEGIFYELERRMEQELIGFDTRSPQYLLGERAGARSG